VFTSNIFFKSAVTIQIIVETSAKSLHFKY